MSEAEVDNVFGGTDIGMVGSLDPPKGDAVAELPIQQSGKSFVFRAQAKTDR